MKSSTRVLCGIGTVLASLPWTASAENPRCDPYATEPARVPWINRLRWEASFVAAQVADPFDIAGGVGLGVSRLYDKFYVLSFDVGTHVTGMRGSDGNIALLAEVEFRLYGRKLQQSLGVDECGYGRKNRRSSETRDGAGYVLGRLGYGHFEYEGPQTRDTFGITVGLGYDINQSLTTSVFVQAGYRFDVVGSNNDLVRESVASGGPFLEIGLRL